MGEGRWGLRQLGVFGHPRCLMLYYCWFSGLLGLCFLDMVTLHFFFPKSLVGCAYVGHFLLRGLF